MKTTSRKTWKKVIFVAAHHPKFKICIFEGFYFFWILMRTPWCPNVRHYPWAEMFRKHFKSEEKSLKMWKNVWFSVLFITEHVFFKGVYRKTKKVKTLSASIRIPNYTFSKNKTVNSWILQVQCLMKTIDFYKIQKVFQCKNALKIIL